MPLRVDSLSRSRRQTSGDTGAVPTPLIAMSGFARMGTHPEGSTIGYDDSEPSSHIEQNHCSFEGRYTLLRRYTEDERLSKTLLRFEVAGDSSNMIQDKVCRH